MKKILFYFLFLFSTLGNAQNPGDVAQNFGNGSGFQNGLSVMEIQADGKIICGGYFKNYNQETSNNIIRLNTDGTKDASFNVGTGFNNQVNAIQIQSDGKIIVAGMFTSYNGVTSNYIIRLNTDGSKDNSFNIGSGFNNTITTLRIQSDGKILAGGGFSSFNGVGAIRIIRLNADGTRDTTFNPSGSGFSSGTDILYSITEQTDGKILIGGQFSSYIGTSANNIIRLNSNGTVDTSFNIGTGFNDTVRNVAIQTDGKIIVGGIFASYNGVGSNKIVRLNSDGTKDSSFNIGTGFTNNTVTNLSIQSDGKIIVGGSFTTYNGSNGSGIIRLNTDGTKDTSFNLGNVQLIGGVLHTVISTKIESTGKILVASNTVNINQKVITGLMRLTTNGANDNSLYQGNGFNGAVTGFEEQSNGKIIVRGEFSSYNGINSSKVTRLNADGTIDTSFTTGTSFNDTVTTLGLQTDGKIIVGGNFTNYNGTTANRIVRLNVDGSIDSSFLTGTGFNFSVTAITIQQDGKIIVGGSFSNYNGTNKSGLVRLNTNGTLDTSFDSLSSSASTKAIRIQNDGKIIVNSTFNNLVRLNSDGTTDTSFSTGTGFNSSVNDFKIQTDGKILVAGGFTTFNGTSSNKIIRLNSDGSIDTSFTSGTGVNTFCNSIDIQQDGKILVAGLFTSYNGSANNHIVMLNTDGTKDTTFIIGNGFDNYNSAIKVLQDGKILVGGTFTLYRTSYASSNLIKLHSSVSLSTNDFEMRNSVKIYPNPVKDVLNIRSLDNSNIVSVKIYDLQGKLMQETTSSAIDTNNLNSGLYFVNVVTENGQTTKKFIKE